MRNVSSAIYEILNSEQVRYVYLLKLELESGYVFIHNGIGKIEWDGDTYEGVGCFGNVSAIPEESDLTANKVILELSGIPANDENRGFFSRTVFDTNYQNKEVSLWLAVIEEDYLTIVPDPILVFRGTTEDAQISIGAQSIVVQIHATHGLARFNKADVVRYTNEDQQRLYPGDLGMKFVDRSANTELTWGGEDNTPT